MVIELMRKRVIKVEAVHGVFGLLDHTSVRIYDYEYARSPKHNKTKNAGSTNTETQIRFMELGSHSGEVCL
jgi:predicted ThiF/HesA family dinucleotide-utilizing enzyme